MDNIKNLFGNVMTSQSKTGLQDYGSNTKYNNSVDVTTVTTTTTTRNRSVSECSNSNPTEVTTNTNAKLRKDSESYFWIMWRS